MEDPPGTRVGGGVQYGVYVYSKRERSSAKTNGKNGSNRPRLGFGISSTCAAKH